MFCFDDVVQPGVWGAVNALKQGSWRRARGAARKEDVKEVIMLTGRFSNLYASIV